MKDFVLAFDTANEMISVGLGRLDRKTCSIELVASKETEAFRASNVKLLPEIDTLLSEAGISRDDVACVVCGRGPGSFTGVRICMASAKGIAIGLGVALFGVSAADAQAWQQWDAGVRGSVVVLGDAMRKEVYPVRYLLSDSGIDRLNSDFVMKAAELPTWLDGASGAETLITGDALKKYSDYCEGFGTLAQEYCYPTGKGLLLAAQAAWQAGELDPDDATLGNPCVVLPVYTRLSDAEEAERAKFAKQQQQAGVQQTSQVEAPQQAQTPQTEAQQQMQQQNSSQPAAISQPTHVASGTAATLEEKDLTTGVQGGAIIRYQPLEAVWVSAVEALEAQTMGSDAWHASQIMDELPRGDRTWWAAYEMSDSSKRAVSPEDAKLIGYAGGWIVDGQVQVLKVATDPAYRRRGIAQELLAHIARDARDLGASEMTLEVRLSNTGAHAFYERLGLKRIGVRPRYYSDREDAVIYTGPLPLAEHDVAGMELRLNDAVKSADANMSAQSDQPLNVQGKLILAIETSCDETAAALIDEAGTIVADVVASQIDFHSRFGGVVPEIASRKHIEAIGGVAQECLEQARIRTGKADLAWYDLAAVSVTYAPGLVGALVVGLAFAKGLAWAADKPLIGVNHLEGHLYANKLACPDIQPPMVVSLVSGGHTMLVHVKDWGNYETMGTTLDDAVGEAFDKVAKAMGLGYPGGPLISRLAEKGNPKAIQFPRALMHSGDLQFSLSGLKTSVMTYLQKEKQAGREVNQEDVAASFQAAVIDVQVAKAKTALQETGAREFCLGGGVAANPELRHAYEEMCDEMGVRLTMPPLSACTDNAAMIALVALDRYKAGKFFSLDCDVAAHALLDDAY
ncbi:MAG: tRNA (adenosine(37)-N6)-threonylcarbamoyltransferase complex transferase subunit TsaD [Eggerthellaceae bacterium]|nr:tRNA (adenosine(37)-N6)-threonylcarbamoyltransferase complex transferase subunit TsaD [Eggerthellaceae bacterium]